MNELKSLERAGRITPSQFAKRKAELMGKQEFSWTSAAPHEPIPDLPVTPIPTRRGKGVPSVSTDKAGIPLTIASEFSGFAVTPQKQSPRGTDEEDTRRKDVEIRQAPVATKIISGGEDVRTMTGAHSYPEQQEQEPTSESPRTKQHVERTVPRPPWRETIPEHVSQLSSLEPEPPRAPTRAVSEGGLPPIAGSARTMNTYEADKAGMEMPNVPIPMYDAAGNRIIQHGPGTAGGSEDDVNRRGAPDAAQIRGRQLGGSQDDPARRRPGGGGDGGGGRGAPLGGGGAGGDDGGGYGGGGGHDLSTMGGGSTMGGIPPFRPRRRGRRRGIDEEKDAFLNKFVSKFTTSLAQQMKQGRSAAGPVVVQQPMMPHVISSGGGGGKKPTPAEQAKIVIKQNVKQIVNERTRRKKASRTQDTRSAVNKRKEYNALKKSLKKRFSDLKKQEFKSASAEIKKLKPAERKKARAKLKKDLTDKLRALVAKMPSSTKKSANELERLITVIKKLAW